MKCLAVMLCLLFLFPVISSEQSPSARPEPIVLDWDVWSYDLLQSVTDPVQKEMKRNVLVHSVKQDDAILYSAPCPAHKSSAGYESLGSGVDLGNHQIITNVHVIRFSKTVTANGRSERIVSQIQAADLALLQDALSDATTPQIEVADWYPGEPVFTIGNPHGKPNVVTKGNIIESKHVRMDDTPFDGQALITTVEVKPGNSGGALWNYKNQLVGIAEGFYCEPDKKTGLRYSIFIPIKPHLWELLSGSTKPL